MPPEDGDPAQQPGGPDAFAETVAPVSTPPAAQAPPPVLSARTQPSSSGHEATVAAPLDGAPPSLPEVAPSLYTRDHEIARGGMGRILSATDSRLGRRVAIKQLLEPAPDQIARFQREALITARLQHPGIVPVYEAGRWPGGEPFFAMKLVKGKPLDRVIADATTLDARLAILPRLTAACDAIAYAHAARIIHRDLKPGNVLLGEFGETVVIDWGLAKDLDEDEPLDPAGSMPRPSSRRRVGDEPRSTTLTVAGAVMGTPAYMAPEQARGEPLDQRADVFALGAMLYHVLAGAPPYDARTATDVIAAAALGKVVPLRDRERRAPADLVAIVDRAMAQDPAARYPDASDLATELRRFLTGQLVDAHRYTRWQKLWRLVKKHQAAVSIAALALVVFAVGGTLAVERIVDARDLAQREQAIATSRKHAAEQLIDFMFDELRVRLEAAGNRQLLASLGAEVRRYFDTLSSVPGAMPAEDELRLARASELVGRADVLSGKPDLALETWRLASERAVRILGQDRSRASRALRREIARFDFETARVHRERGKSDLARDHFDRAESRLAQLLGEDPSWSLAARDLAEVHDARGDMLRVEGKLDDAFDQYARSLELRRKTASAGGGLVTEENSALARSHLKLGSVFYARGDSAAAHLAFREALALRERLLAADPENVVRQQELLEVQREYGDNQRRRGELSAAIETYRKALGVSDALVRRDPSNTEWQYQRGNLLSELGLALDDSGAYDDALLQLRAAVQVFTTLSALDATSAKYMIPLSRAQMRVGDTELDQGNLDAAMAQYRTALEIRQGLASESPTSVAFRRGVASSHAKLAETFRRRGDAPRAIDALERSLELRRALVAEVPSQFAFLDELASTEIALGRLLAQRAPTRALALVAQGVEHARSLVRLDAPNDEWQQTLTRALIAQAVTASDAQARRDAYSEALALAGPAAERSPQSASWPCTLAEIHAGLADVAATAGDTRAARASWRQARELLEALDRDRRMAASYRPLLERARAVR